MNIAQCKKRLDEIGKEREQIYKEKLERLDAEAGKLQQRIKDICQHHTDMLLVDTRYYEDEYGKSLDSSTTWEVDCIICKAHRSVNVSYMKKHPEMELQELFNMSEAECRAIR